MAVATRGKNAITEVMCQSILSAKDFILCYKEAKFMYTYKIALVEFFIDAYLDIEKDVPSSLQEDIWQFVSDLNDEFEAFMNSTSDLGIMHSYERKIKKDLNASNIVGPPIYFEGLFGRYRLKNILGEYIYESVLSCLENIFQLRLVIKNSKDEKIVAKIILQIKKLKSHVTKREQKQKVAHIMEIIKKNPQLRQIRNRVLEEDDDGDLEEDEAPILGMSKKMSRSQMSGGGQKFTAVGKAWPKFGDSNLDEQQKASFFSKKDSVAVKMAHHLSDLQIMEAFQEASEMEFEELAKSIINLKEKSLLGFGGVCTLSPVDVIEAIIDLTDMDGIQLTLDQIPTALKVLRKIIEVENPNTMKPAAEWTGEEDDPTPDIIRNQNLLANSDACNLVANLIKNEKGDAIIYEALLLGIALLIGGNHNSQMKFWEFMTEDNENAFLIVLSETLKNHFFKVMEHAQEYNELMKKIQSLSNNKIDEMDEDEAEGQYEVYEELMHEKERLDARSMPDTDGDMEDYTSIKYSSTI